MIFKTIFWMITFAMFSWNQADVKMVEAEGVKVFWTFEKDSIHFAIESPGKGWMAIGFNDQNELAGTYLLMGRILTPHQSEVEEYYTFLPGDYQSFGQLGFKSVIANVAGQRSPNSNRISFSLPLKAVHPYRYQFVQDTEVNLLIAYSRSNDFQHHSRMRTSLKIIL